MVAPLPLVSQRTHVTKSQCRFQKSYLKFSALSTHSWMSRIQICVSSCFLLKAEHILMKQSRLLQGLVSITTSQTVSLYPVTVATVATTAYFQFLDISTLSLQLFLCLLKMIPPPYIVYNCPVQLQTDSFQHVKAKSENQEMERDYICISLHTERWGACERQSEHLQSRS